MREVSGRADSAERMPMPGAGKGNPAVGMDGERPVVFAILAPIRSAPVSADR